MSSSQWNLGFFVQRSMNGQIFMSILTLPALLGMFRSIYKRDVFTAAWPWLILLVTPRMALASGLAIPTALLSAYGIEIAGAFVRRLVVEQAHSPRAGRITEAMKSSIGGFPVPALAILLVLTLLSSTKMALLFSEEEIAERIDAQSREAMLWVSRNTDPEAGFVVISSAGEWWEDRHAEWFPLLAGRSSLTTAQGLEWAGPGAFTTKLDEIGALKSVQAAEPDLLPEHARRKYCAADYVALFAPRDAAVRHAFETSPVVEAAYSNSGAVIFKVRPEVWRCAADG
jgi:hypothetical protein